MIFTSNFSPSSVLTKTLSPILACKITFPNGDSSDIFCSRGFACTVPTSWYTSSSEPSSSKNFTVIYLPKFVFSSSVIKHSYLKYFQLP